VSGFQIKNVASSFIRFDAQRLEQEGSIDEKSSVNHLPIIGVMTLLNDGETLKR
jgi:hypothetical protein